MHEKVIKTKKDNIALLSIIKTPDYENLNNLNITFPFYRLIQMEQEWVPHAESSSLYIRPTLIGTEPTLGVGAANEVLLFVILSPVGPYFASGLKPVNLLADPNFVRAWPGGCGYAKMGSNYAPTMWTQVSYIYHLL